MRHLITNCSRCGEQIEWIESPTGGWWKHYLLHPGDDHDAEVDYDELLSEVVFQALGAASACWENLSRAGIFESDRAKQIGDDLIADLKVVMIPR
jgi:hypothetical protein